MSLTGIFDKHAAIRPWVPEQSPEDPALDALADRHAGNANIKNREMAHLLYKPGGHEGAYALPGDHEKEDTEEEEEEYRKKEAIRRFLSANRQFISQVQQDAVTFLEQNIEKLDKNIASVEARLQALERLREGMLGRMPWLMAARDETQRKLVSGLEKANEGDCLCHAVHEAERGVMSDAGPSDAQIKMREIADHSLRADGGKDEKGPLIIACRSRSGEIIDYYLIDAKEAHLLSELPEGRRAAAQEKIDAYNNGLHSDRQIYDLPDFIKTAMAAQGHGTIDAPHDEVTFLIENIQDSLDKREELENEISVLENDMEGNSKEIAALRSTLDDLKTQREEAVGLLRDIREKNLDGAELQAAMEKSSFSSSWNSFLESTGAKEIMDMAAEYMPTSVTSAVSTVTSMIMGSPSSLQESFTTARDALLPQTPEAPDSDSDPATTGPKKQAPGIPGA